MAVGVSAELAGQGRRMRRATFDQSRMARRRLEQAAPGRAATFRTNLRRNAELTLAAKRAAQPSAGAAICPAVPTKISPLGAAFMGASRISTSR
jgi:hypothetical protein